MPRDSITRRQRIEPALAALGDSEAIYRATFDEAPVGIGLIDLAGRFLRVNRRLGELLGVTADALLSSTLLELTHPDDRFVDAGAFDRLLDGTLDRYVGEKRYRHADGRYVWGAVSVNLQRNGRGEPLYFLATVEDISARRAAEDRSRSASAHLRAVVSALPMSLWSLDRHGVVTLSEGRLLEKLGLRPGQLVGRSQFELYADNSEVMDWTRRAPINARPSISTPTITARSAGGTTSSAAAVFGTSPKRSAAAPATRSTRAASRNRCSMPSCRTRSRSPGAA